MIHPALYLQGKPIGELAVVPTEPAFIDLAVIHAAVGVNQIPQGDQSGTGLPFVLIGVTVET